MSRMRITNARVIDPFREIDEVADVFVEGGLITTKFSSTGDCDVLVEADGLWLVPRISDLHVHFRDPGQEWKEDLLSGSRAAAAGGVTMVGVMPNTVPVTDNADAIEALMTRVKNVGGVRVWPIGAVTVGSAGEQDAPWERMRQSGAKAFSDDGRPVTDAGILSRALRWSQASGCPIIQHAEEPSLSQGGFAHDGLPARAQGIAGVPAAAEAVMVWRDVALVDAVGGRFHVAHCSTPGALEAVAWARSRGLAVTCEATPHHLFLTDQALDEWKGHPITKVNPPLRPPAMRHALQQAVQSGVVDVIASDHAPHHADEKALSYAEAPFGISGLETLLGVILTVFYHTGRIKPLDLLAKVTRGPHRVVGDGYPGLVPGAPADMTLIDPDVSWIVDPDRFVSRGHNTPMAGRALRGRAVATMVGGRWTMRDGEVLV